MLKLEDRDWKSFRIGDMFEYRRGQRQIAKVRTKGNVPYYSASDSNNGLTDLIANPAFVEDRSAIICSTFCDAYYVDGGFTASDEITILKNSRLNKLNGLFIAKMITQQKEKYSFGHKAFSKVLIRDHIMLPVTDNGEPDYQFMEDYVREMIGNKLQRWNGYVNYKEI